MPLALLAQLPWKWICIGLAIAGLVFGIYRAGVTSERGKWVAAENAKKLENIEAARKIEAAEVAHNAEIEKRALDANAKADDLAKRLDAAVSHGVRLAGACKPRVPDTPTAPGNPEPATSGDGVLPEQIGRDLVDLAREAERVLTIARAGEEHAVKP